MPKPTVLTSDTRANIDMPSIHNINDLLIGLVLKRVGSHHKGYGPLSAKEIRDKLLKVGIDKAGAPKVSLGQISPLKVCPK